MRPLREVIAELIEERGETEFLRATKDVIRKGKDKKWRNRVDYKMQGVIDAVEGKEDIPYKYLVQ